MADVSLNITIAGRSYPLTVKKNEEEKVLKAAEMINDKIKEFEKNYGVRDKQDLLAMSALNLLSSSNNTPDKSPELDLDPLNQLDFFVTSYLQKQGIA